MRRLLRAALAVALAVAGIPAHAAWYEAKSSHFIIDGDVDAQELKDYATKLERFDQAVRMARGMPDPQLTDAGKLRIYFVRNAREWADLGGGYALGIYYSRAEGSYAFVPKMKGDSVRDMNSDILFFHEYAHHLMFQNWAAALPTWFVEGFAEFLSTAKVNDDGSVILGAAANHRSTGVHSLHHDLPLSQMLGDSERWLSGWQWELTYSRGWLLTHYLTFEPSRRGQLDRYIANIQSGKGALESAKAAFGDLNQLDNELDRYAASKEITGVLLRPDPAKLGTISVRALSEAQSALMPIQMRSDFGVPTPFAGILAGKARKLAEAYPWDPFAQTTLAQTEYLAKNYAAAEAAADRALTTDPNYVRALIYKGRAEMALAKTKAAAVDWSKVRGLFAKANHLDTENAEPLMLYYLSFEAAKEPPTDSATKGLLYALVLAPRDQTLRWLAVRQLLRDRNIDEAKRTLVPLAYDPHGGSRDKADQVLTAIQTGDPAKALTLVSGPDRD
jgi:tetratricopeptide (TPR) repeat protein